MERIGGVPNRDAALSAFRLSTERKERLHDRALKFRVL
jgi:hypothetical protein